jgi:glycine cleavage system H protein
MKIQQIIYTEELNGSAFEETGDHAASTTMRRRTGHVVFVELPAVGAEVKQMESFGTIEAVKAVSDLFAPVSGQVVEINEALADQPELVNKDPYVDGWMIKIKMSDLSELESLLKADAYKSLIS